MAADTGANGGKLRILLRLVVAWLVGAGVAYVAGSVAQSIFVIRELTSIGAEMGAGVWMKVILHDLGHLGFGGKYIWYGANLCVGFLIAFPCALIVARFLKLPLGLVATVAGAVAILTMIMIVNANSPSTIFAGTRGWDGMLAQLIAGALGGAIFAACFRPPESGRTAS